MRAFLSILLTTTTLPGYAEKGLNPSTALFKPVDTTVTNINSTATYLALGDSYTIGESVPLEQSFPYQLSNMLKLKTRPTIIATTGWTTDDLIHAINTNGPTKTYDFVTLLIGVNDQYRGMSVDNYRTKFKQLLQTAITSARGNKKHVFVLSIPDYGVTPFANGDDSKIGPEIDSFNTINYAESNKAGVNYLNITTLSRRAAINPSLIADDGLHPSSKMYALWVAPLARIINGVFK